MQTNYRRNLLYGAGITSPFFIAKTFCKKKYPFLSIILSSLP